MNFFKHSDYEGLHAPFGASQPSWIHYTDEKMIDRLKTMKATEYGTRLHAFAAEAISLGQELPNTTQTLNMFVNDAIGYHMTPEQILFYSPLFFGTADAISFRKENGIETLRIHDLKTGVTKVHPEQLEIYTALFCLEYKKKPADLYIELRLYQNDDRQIWNPDIDTITHIMDKIVTSNKFLTERELGEE